MTVGIRGLGLIGGSFEKAFRAAGHDVVNLKDASSADIARCADKVIRMKNGKIREIRINESPVSIQEVEW